jgi:hypothetical protein
MENEISIGFNQVPLFPCFTCQGIISPTASNCRFCGAPVDYEAARSAAGQQARANQALNRAKTLGILAGTLPMFFLLSFFALLGSRAFLALLVVFPMLLGLWWIRYGTLSTEDRGFKKARGISLIALAFWGAMAAVYLAVALLLRR